MVLKQIAGGSGNRDIAEKPFSEETIMVHIKRITEKVGASDRTQAVTIALRRGTIQLSEAQFTWPASIPQMWYARIPHRGDSLRNSVC